jgi:hypothetical protein
MAMQSHTHAPLGSQVKSTFVQFFKQQTDYVPCDIVMSCCVPIFRPDEFTQIQSSKPMLPGLFSCYSLTHWSMTDL